MKHDTKNKDDKNLKNEDLINFNEMRSKIIDAKINELYEISNELFLLEPHPNDLYNQN